MEHPRKWENSFSSSSCLFGTLKDVVLMLKDVAGSVAAGGISCPLTVAVFKELEKCGGC